jgi:predicted XRE-type DNA-binding protein
MTNGPKKVPERGVKAIPVRRGSGNVFEDIGVPRSGEALAKAEIASRIAAAIEKRGLSQTAAAKLLDIDQSDVSDLVRGKLRGFSTDRLLRFVVALGQDVEIVIHRRAHRGRIGSLRVLDDEPKRAAAGRK